jgi:hypothetical protein
MAIVCLLGGSSRSDLASLPLLRGLAVLFAFWAATRLDLEDLRRIRAPLCLLLLLLIWNALQLVPLPPSIWQTLPGREAVVAIDRLLGQPDIWRPISLSPSQSWNSLLAMSVPIAALLLAARMTPEDHPRLMLAIVAIAGVGALLGFIQLLAGSGSLAYLYRITNPNSMVGLFANRNHNAYFLAIALIVAAALLRDGLTRKQQNGMVQGVLIFFALLFAAVAALIGSRSGFVAGVVAFCVGYAMVGAAWRSVPSARAASRARRGERRASPAISARWRDTLLIGAPVLIVGVMGAVVWSSGRSTAVTRLAGQVVADDMRVQAWPTVRTMIETYWAAGSGFGSFPDVYKMFEPDALLQPSYFNHAHNDWAELLMTGGLPLAALTLAALLWLARTLAAKGFRNLLKGYRGDVRLVLIVVVGILAAMSIVDYPLRVPSIQVVAIMLIMTLIPRTVGRP